MRALVSTFLLGAFLVASPAFAQQIPWVPRGYTGSVTYSQAPARAHGRSSKGDIVKSAESRPAKPITDELYDDACHSRHAVFSCPGTP